MKKAVLLAMVFSLAGCATQTGVVPAGQDTYMTSRQDNGITASAGTLQAENLKEAKQFCASKGRDFSVISGTDVPRALGQIPQSTLYFKCA